MRAQDIIQDAYERCNRLSPGETLSADDADYGLRRLNLLVDELSAHPLFLFRDVLTSAAQTGNVTLGAGSWAAIAPGSDVISIACNDLPLGRISVQQYNEQHRPVTTGTPEVFAHDGMATIYMSPEPTGQTLTIQTRATVSEFADLTTDYTLKDGWASALGAGLAVRIAPNIIGAIPADLIRAETKAMAGVSGYEPAIVDVCSPIGVGNAYPGVFF